MIVNTNKNSIISQGRLHNKQNPLLSTCKIFKQNSNNKKININNNKSLKDKILVNNKNKNKKNNMAYPLSKLYTSKKVQNFQDNNINKKSNKLLVEEKVNNPNDSNIIKDKDMQYFSVRAKSTKNNFDHKTLSNVITNTYSTSSLVSVIKNEENNKENNNSLNKKTIYKKPNNGNKFSSPIIITDYNFNNKKIFQSKTIKPNSNTFNNNYLYANIDKIKNIKGTFQTSEEKFNYNSTININKHKYFNTTKKYFYTKMLPERKTYSSFNSLSINSNIDNDFCNAKIRDTLNYNINENNFFSVKRDTNSFIYVRKNNSNKKSLKRNFTVNNHYYENKIPYNKLYNKLNKNNLIQNAYYVQKNVILIQKNYRMHLSCVKKYILKALRDIVIGINKIYFIFFKNYFKKFRNIINMDYINKDGKKKSNQNIKNRSTLNNKNKNLKCKYYLKTQPKTIQKLNINIGNKNHH